MKKLTVILLTLVLVLSFAACGSKKDDSNTTSDDATYEIALVTDVGNIDDRSFNQSAWEGVKAYAEANNISYNYYRPTEDSTASRIETITTAVDNGAKMIVCPGYLFEDAIFEVQDTFTEVAFILIDGTPHSADYSEFKTAANVYCITYQEEQAGFFAGYAAVMDGYRKLGFLGGMAVDPVKRYGIGYVQGAEAAAKELGLAAGEVELKYWYSGSFLADDGIKNKMAGWYTEGTEIIFSCGGKILLSCIAAADEADGKIIGVDVDQSGESDKIVTSAYKNMTSSVEVALQSFYDNGGAWDEAHAGIHDVFGAATNMVGIPTADTAWRFSTFTVDQYNTVYADVVAGIVAVSDDISIEPNDYGTLVTVDVQE